VRPSKGITRENFYGSIDDMGPLQYPMAPLGPWLFGDSTLAGTVNSTKRNLALVWYIKKSGQSSNFFDEKNTDWRTRYVQSAMNGDFNGTSFINGRFSGKPSYNASFPKGRSNFPFNKSHESPLNNCKTPRTATAIG
jgi:hypothetical protein